MPPDESVAHPAHPLDVNLRLAFLAGFETTCRQRYGRPPTARELERALLRYPEWRAAATEPLDGRP